MKYILKLVLLPVVLVLRMIMLVAKLVGNLGAFILSPVMLFILGCGIYCIFKARWTDVALLFGMEAVISLLLFGGLWLYANVSDLCEYIDAFRHS